MAFVPGRPLRRLVCAACLLCASLCLVLVDGPAAPASVPARASVRSASDDAGPRRIALDTVGLMNSVRARHGLGRLRVHRSLARAARGHARNMSRRGYLGHTSPDGASLSDRVRRTGYLDGAMRWTVGENIALGTGGASGPQATVRAWMRSPAHRANVLNAAYREVGLGVAPRRPGSAGRGPQAIYVAVFGRRG